MTLRHASNTAGVLAADVRYMRYLHLFYGLTLVGIPGESNCGE